MKILSSIFSVIFTFIVQFQFIQSEKCNQKGIIDMKENSYYNVKLFDSPTKKSNGTFCNKVWTDKGGCCVPKDASQFATNWLHAVKSNANSTRVMMPIFKKSLEFVDVVKRFMEKNKAKIVSKNGMNTKQYDEFHNQILNYIEGIHFFQDKEEAYNSTLEGCYTNLYKLRANAVCLRCSSDFDKFYNTKENTINTAEETCKILVGNCTQVFAYNAEINSFYYRLVQMKHAMGGSVTPTNTKGMLWSEIMQFKMCASDLDTCMSDEKMLKSLCYEFTVGDMNPDVEGDSNVWVSGLKTLRQMALGRPLKDGKRLLESSIFDEMINTVERLKFYNPSRILEEESSLFDNWRIAASSGNVIHKSSNSGSGSGNNKKSKGIGIGHLTMVFRKGADILKDYDSEATITPDFSLESAIQAGSELPTSALKYNVLVSTIFILMGIFMRV